jgi:xylulose-5-phosphate/fructose-6-phosphate phosphoketolase
VKQFIAHVITTKAQIVRMHPPPDTNTLLSLADHCLRSRN